MEMKAFILWCF